jgi:ABC-type transport system substrate-binding protein
MIRGLSRRGRAKNALASFFSAKGNDYNLKGFFIPPGAYGHNPNLTPWTYDTTKARSLLAEAGYPEGFEVKIITYEAWKLETQIIARMLERIGLKVTLDVLTHPEFLRKTYIPLLDKPPEEQEWDLTLGAICDFNGHTGATFLTWGHLEEGEYRWTEYDPAYEKMWKDMARTVNLELQEEKIRQMQQYLHDRIYVATIYSPITLYAVNKEVDFVAQKFGFMRLKETSVTDNHWSIRKNGRPQ